MPSAGKQAIIPKARGMFAKRINYAEYEEMIRRRTVPEVSALLRRHPYFKDSLSALTSDPHRGQIEELLNMDVFQKYEAMLRYDFGDESFSAYYLEECELREILRALHLVSVGLGSTYLSQVPSYLVGKGRVDFFALAAARTLPAFVEEIRRTPYYKPLKESISRDPALRDFARIEANLLRAYYVSLFRRIDESFSGQERETVRMLFLDEVEMYNIEVLLRIKTYFPRTYPVEELAALLMPYVGRVPRQHMQRLIEAPTPEAFIAIYRALPMTRAKGVTSPEEYSIFAGRNLYKKASRVLHMSSSPYAALAAFITLAKLQKDNVVNVIEGVRYSMKPEQINALLKR